MPKPTTTKPGKDRCIEEAVSYAVGHRLRIEMLAALHEGPCSAKELSRVVHQPLSTVTHHIEELLASGSIEIARTEQVGNINQNFYCVIKLAYYSHKAWGTMTLEERQITAALILQSSTSEAFASLWAGKLHSDPQVMLAWNRVDLDAEGRDELAEEQGQSWERIKEIEARSANRRAETGEPATTYVVVSLGFERSRNSAPMSVEPKES